MKRQRQEISETDDLPHTGWDELEKEYRRQIEYYKAEEKKAKETLREREKAFLEERQRLEAELEKEQRLVSGNLRLQLLSLRVESGAEPRSRTTDNTELEAIKSELETYKKELLVYKTEYEHARADGFFDGLQERVLHLSENPYAEKIAEKQLFLQKEVVQPLSPLPSGDAPEMGPPSAVSQSEVENLKKRIERMKEVFATQTNRFRDAVYQLTGWNVDLSLHENKVRLRSRYAANRDDYVELTWNGADRFEILDTDFVSSLDSHLFAAITVSHSFPVFLGAVTQDLFEKQTVYATPS